MRTIGSLQESEAKRKKNVQVFGMSLLGLMILSTVGYAFFSNPNVGNSGTSTSYEGLTRSGDRWVFGPTDKKISLTYSPEEVANTSIGLGVFGLGDFLGEPLYVDADNQGIKSELGGVFGYYASRMQEACYGSCTLDVPEKDCSENMIVWRESSNNTVTQKDKCVFIAGDLRTVDAYVYKIFGISNS